MAMMMKMMMIVMMMVGIQALLSHIISYWLNHKIEDGSPYWKNYVLYIILITLEAILYIILLVIAMCYISFSPSWKQYYILNWSLLCVIYHSHLLGSYIMRRRPPTWSPTGGLVQWRQWTLGDIVWISKVVQLYFFEYLDIPEPGTGSAGRMIQTSCRTGELLR